MLQSWYSFPDQAYYVLMSFVSLVLSVIAQEGEWSKWSQWSTCSVSCGYGIQKRQKAWQSNNPRGPNTDTFTYSDIMECFTNTPCPSKFICFYFAVLLLRYRSKIARKIYDFLREIQKSTYLIPPVYIRSI